MQEHALVPLQSSHATAAAQLLVDGFRAYWPNAWPTHADALAEVQEAFAPERIALAAVSGAELLGWIGAQPQYSGRVWELHPLVVRADAQGRGIGRALVRALEGEVARRGGITLWLGTDDEAGLTSVGGIELYPDVLGKLAQVRSERHPLEFYRRLGFELVGIVPDANGWGKPDLLLARRVVHDGE